ncbi:MAG: response regulator [Acidobacteriota bacterium]|nr:response regulator [Acidobacteriota bacterium]
MLGLVGLAAEEPLSESQGHYLGQCREAADQLLRMADDLAELARPEGSVAGSAEFDTLEAIEEIAGLMGALAARSGLAFHWDAGPGVPTHVLGDKYLLQDMLRRLLDNAIRYTASGSIHLSVGCSVHLSAGAGSEIAMLTFEISDTGAGMPDEILEVFNTDSRQPQIRGLSLRILHKRLAGLNGTIAIMPNSPCGTKVRVRLPVTLAALNSDASSLAETEISSSPLRLLVAEDSDDSFFLFMSYVKAKGHRVSRAINGAQAVDMAMRGEYDFIVMDVNMPGMNGYSATRLIREWETEQGRTRLPILLLSADDLHRQVRIGSAAGCSGYLTKPTTKAQVLAALNFYIHKTASSVPVRQTEKTIKSL